MNFKKLFHIKTIRKYLFTYVLIFMLPLIAMNLFFFQMTQSSIKTELIRNQRSLLEKLQI